MNYTISDRIFLAQKYYKIFNFYGGSNGSNDLWSGVLDLLAVSHSHERKNNIDNGEEKVSSRGKNSLLTEADVKAILAATEGTKERVIMHESEVLTRARNEAKKHESVRMGTRKGAALGGKKEEQLRRAANLYAQIGDLEKYCSILVDLGDWTEAIAVAPGVSLDYWKELTLKYAEHLANLSSEKCLPYYITINEDINLIDFYVKRNDINNALIIAKMNELKTEKNLILNEKKNENFNENENFLQLNEHKIESKYSEENDLDNEIMETEKGCMNDSKRDLVRTVNVHAALRFLTLSKPVHAAAQFLSVGDVDSCLEILSTCGEDNMAYAVALCMGHPTTVYLIKLAEKMAAYKGNIDDALEVLDSLPRSSPHSTLTSKRTPNPSPSPASSPTPGRRAGDRDNERDIEEFILLEKGLLLSKYCEKHPNNDKNEDNVDRNKFRSPSDWVAKAKEEEAIGCDSEATIAYMLGREYTQAAKMGISIFKKLVREPLDVSLSHSVKRMRRGLKYLRASEIETSLKRTFLCYIFWFCAHEAADLGLWETGWAILKNLRTAVRGAETGVKGDTFPVVHMDILYQELIFRILSEDSDGLILLDYIINLKNLNGQDAKYDRIDDNQDNFNDNYNASVKNNKTSNKDESKNDVNDDNSNANDKHSMNNKSSKEGDTNDEDISCQIVENEEGVNTLLGENKNDIPHPKSRFLSISLPSLHSISLPQWSRRGKNLSKDNTTAIGDNTYKENGDKDRFIDNLNIYCDEYIAPSIEVIRILETLKFHLQVVPTTSSSKTEKETWGRNRNAIEILKDLKNLGEALSLPSIHRLFDQLNSKNVLKNNIEIIAKGSLLPVSNLHMRDLESCITHRKISETIVDLNNSNSNNNDNDSSDKKNEINTYAVLSNSDKKTSEINGPLLTGENKPLLAGINEALGWNNVLPYTPNMSGEFIYLNF
mmetsp:Transcript_6613/g.6733  ORF Transcript_6613/g.6733 Transcript_6613/m.6733 type:complete len:942 (-) Transcript_6613:99-2924(-)